MNVVIVGGGFSGVKTALELANKPGFFVTLISKGADFEYHGSLYRSATGHSPLEVVIRLGEIFEHAKNVEVILDSITALSTSVKSIKGATGRQYAYDRLIMCLGNDINFFGIPGLDTYAHTLYTIHDTIELRSRLVALFSLPDRKKIRAIVIGAGPSGTEVAAELQNFASVVADKYGINKKTVDVDLIEGGSRVLPTLNEKVSKKALIRLQKLGVNVMLDKRVVSCSKNVVTMEDGERAADIIIWTAGSKCAGIYAMYPALFEIERGRVKVDEQLRSPLAQNIYVIGDNAATQYSGLAQTAITDAIFVAKNLVRENKGKLPLAYKPSMPVYTVPIGGKWAVMQGSKSTRSGSFAWMMRRRQDLFVYKNFAPIRKAYKLWRRTNHLAAF